MWSSCRVVEVEGGSERIGPLGKGVQAGFRKRQGIQGRTPAFLDESSPALQEVVCLLRHTAYSILTLHLRLKIRGIPIVPLAFPIWERSLIACIPLLNHETNQVGKNRSNVMQ